MLALGGVILAIALILWVVDRFVNNHYRLLWAAVGFIILAIFILHFLVPLLERG